MTDVRLGALCWNQYTTWPDLLAAGQRADRLGYDSLWTWDHLYPIVGSHEGPIFEGWLTLAAWAQATEHVRIGLMVGANTFREPALTAKMATTLDHISNGRAILGIGGAWFETEHRRTGSRSATGSRSGCAGSARPCRSCAGCSTASDRPRPGRATRAKAVRNDPPPIQERLPLLIGGGGEQVTLKLVARYGDANNVGGGVRDREAQGSDPRPALRDRRARPGRDRADDRHRRRDHPRLARRGESASRRRSSSATATPTCGPTSRSARPRTSPSGSRPYLEIGYRHLIAGFPSPHDEESMTRLATEVRPLLERAG